MTEMFGEAWPPMSVPDLAPDDDDDSVWSCLFVSIFHIESFNLRIYIFRPHEVDLDNIPVCVLIILVKARSRSRNL